MVKKPVLLEDGFLSSSCRTGLCSKGYSDSTARGYQLAEGLFCMEKKIKLILAIFIICFLTFLILYFYFINNTFNKKIICGELKNKIEARFENNLQDTQIYQEYKTLEEIFYSQKLNSCLYSYFKSTFNNPFEEKNVVFSYVLADALTNNIIIELKSPSILAGTKNETKNKFNIEVSKFK